MCGLGFLLFVVGHGGVYCEAVWFGARWALECRDIIFDVFGRGREETTHIMSGLDLVVWDLEEDQEEQSVHTQHVIVGWFSGEIYESVGGLFYHHKDLVGSHAFERIGRTGLGGNRNAASCWNRKSRTRG